MRQRKNQNKNGCKYGEAKLVMNEEDNPERGKSRYVEESIEEESEAGKSGICGGEGNVLSSGQEREMQERGGWWIGRGNST